jgi:hypothetical protein
MLHQPKKMRGNQVRQNKLNYRRLADCGSQHTERWRAWSNRRHAGDPSSPKTQLIQKPKRNAAFNGRLGVGPLRTVELRQPTLGAFGLQTCCDNRIVDHSTPNAGMFCLTSRHAAAKFDKTN